MYYDKLIYEAIIDTGAEVLYIPYVIAKTILKTEIMPHKITEGVINGVTGSQKSWITHVSSIEIPDLITIRNVPVTMSAVPDNNQNICNCLEF